MLKLHGQPSHDDVACTMHEVAKAVENPSLETFLTWSQDRSVKCLTLENTATLGNTVHVASFKKG